MADALTDALTDAQKLLPSWLEQLKVAQTRMLLRGSGAIPPYGTFFRWERVRVDWDSYFSSTQYVLKVNDRYMIRSNKTSETWGLFCDGQPFAWRGRFIDAMLLMLVVVGIHDIN
jgi:hypothetical protein